MPSAAPSRPLFAPFERWVDALVDPLRARTTVLWTLAAYAAAWTLFRTIATLPRDLHADETELYAWSLDWTLGNDKHPPLSAWVTKLWFLAVPVTDLGFRLLATANIALALYIGWATMRRYMDPAKSAFGLAMLMLIPFFNFIALKYNANAVLLPLWAATIYCFLRAFERPGWLWGALAGIGAGASMLGKYWSIVLVAGLGLAALLDPRRAAFFRSPAPWLMILAGGAVLAPHLAWLVRHDFPTFAYAGGRTSTGFAANLLDTATYLAGCIGYASVAIAAWWLLLRPSRAALADVAAPADPQARLIRNVQLALILLPMPFAILGGIRIVPLWTMPGWSLLPLVLLGTPLIAVGRAAVRRIAAGVALFVLAMLLASPVVAYLTHRNSAPGDYEYASLLAGHIAREWTQRNGPTPVPLVAGETTLAISTAYYLRTRALPFGPDLAATKAAVTARGGALVCPAADAACLATAFEIAKGGSEIRRSQTRLSRPLFGAEGHEVRDVFMIVPPAAAPVAPVRP
jgi:uncharacterized membrane protein